MIERLGGILQRKFVRDTLTLQLGKVGVLALGFIASIIVPVLMGPESYGTWQLVLTLFGIWQSLNLTGIIPSAQTRFATAVGAKDEKEILNIMGFFVRVTLLYSTASTLLMWLASPLLAHWLYNDSPQIVHLAIILSLTQPTEFIYHLFIITFSSRRQMRHVALLQNMNQLVLVVTAVVAVMISASPTAIVLSRIVYSVVTLIVVSVIYQRTRMDAQIDYPGIGQVLGHVWYAKGKDYWRFGFVNALDKNISNLFTQIPVQIAGLMIGKEAAGYVGLALSALRQQTFFTSAIMDNMQVIVPQSIGRGNYARLWLNFRRVLIALTVGSVVFYGIFAIFAPLVVPLLYGTDWIPAITLLQILAIYGGVTTVGSVFGPLYRAFDFVRGALIIKVITLLIVLPVGYELVQRYQSVGVVWIVNLLYLISVILTVFLTMPELRTRAHEQLQHQTA